MEVHGFKSTALERLWLRLVANAAAKKTCSACLKYFYSQTLIKN